MNLDFVNTVLITVKLVFLGEHANNVILVIIGVNNLKVKIITIIINNNYKLNLYRCRMYVMSRRS